MFKYAHNRSILIAEMGRRINNYKSRRRWEGESIMENPL